LREQDRLEHAAWPRWKKIYKLFCWVILCAGHCYVCVDYV
jgi:hypothetical protein